MVGPEPRVPSPEVTIIVPTHSRPFQLAAALDSIINQDWTSWECVVVDDGSQPPAVLPENNARVRLLRRERPGGPAVARNAGLQVAFGRFVCFLDDDDLMPSWRIRIAIEALEKNPEANCHVGTLVWDRNPKVELIPRRGTRVDPNSLSAGTPSVAMLFLQRDLVPAFDESLRVSEDVDWWLRLWPEVVPVVTDDVVAAIQLHDDPRVGVSPEIRFQARLRTYTKNRHLMSLFGLGRARHLRRVGDAALTAGRSLTAMKFAALALLAQPNRREFSLLVQSGRQLLGRTERD